MNRSGARQSNANELLPISHSPSPISPLSVSKSPATLHLVCTGETFPSSTLATLWSVISAPTRQFSTHSSLILDDSHLLLILDPFVTDSRRFWSVISAHSLLIQTHSSPIWTLCDEVFTTDSDHLRRSGIGKVVVFFFFFLFLFFFSFIPFSSCLLRMGIFIFVERIRECPTLTYTISCKLFIFF